MKPPDTPSSLVPPRAQPLIAAGIAVCLTAGTVWFVAVGGLAGNLVHHDAPPEIDNRFTVDINTAGEHELAQLPGLGATTARRIVDHRREHGPFPSHDRLLDVAGIGHATLTAMRPYLRPVPLPAPPPTADR